MLPAFDVGIHNNTIAFHFGRSTAPQFFTKVLASITLLHSQAFPIVGYQDNLLLRKRLPQMSTNIHWTEWIMNPHNSALELPHSLGYLSLALDMALFKFFFFFLG